MTTQLILIGLSGSGKSTVGALVAATLGWLFVDTDGEIERATGRTIPDIFEHDGEPAFRAIESREMRTALAHEHVVVSTGGGAVLDPAIWDDEGLGSPSALVVWLDASPGELAKRVQAHAEQLGQQAVRPLLGTGDVETRLASMREERLPAYRRAHVVLPVDGRAPDVIAADLTEQVHLANGMATEVRFQVESASSRIKVGNGVRWEVGWSAIWRGSRRRPCCVGSGWCKCLRPCCRWWIAASGEKRASTTRLEKT